ncbi:TPA: hypothetical protein ACHVCJ_000672 [Streptococcus suis]
MKPFADKDKQLDFYITYSIDKHCKLYPDDLILLSQEMNFPIDELKYNQK